MFNIGSMGVLYMPVSAHIKHAYKHIEGKIILNIATFMTSIIIIIATSTLW